MDIEKHLKDLGIPYEKTEHKAVFTCGDAERELRNDLPGAHTKNLFLRDKKGRRHFLVVVGYQKTVDTKELRTILDTTKLSMASPERLMTYMQLTPGSVTLLGLINDKDHNIEVVIDENIWNADAVLCHPMINTATLSIPHVGLETFLESTGHTPTIVDVPHLKD